MKAIILLFVLVLAHEVLSGIPVRCVVPSKEALLSVELENLKPCNLKTTCQFMCLKDRSIQYGSKFYIDLKYFENQYKSQYKQYCHSVSPTEWKEAKVKSILEDVKLFNFKDPVVKKINSILDGVFEKFSKICSGGQQVTKEDVEEVLQQVREEILIARNAPRSEQIIYLNQPSGEEKVLLVVHEAVGEFQRKLNSGDFKYCDCRAFAASIGQTNWFNSNVAAKFCPSDFIVEPLVRLTKLEVERLFERRQTQPIKSLRESILENEMNEEIKALENEIDELE
jgi:hypothetical protein